MLHIRVPAGIGDISWSYSKLSDIGEELNIQISADNPKRSLEYVNLLPNVSKVEYTQENFHSIVDNSIPPTTNKRAFLEISRKKFVNFSPNRYLEQGWPLNTFMPDLPTNYHYNIKTTNGDSELATHVNKHGTNLFGIYTSSYQNIAHWSAWHLDEWLEFIRKVKRRIPSATFVFLGASYDKPFCDDLCLCLKGIEHINLAGQTTPAQVIEVIKRLKYFVSFPCGLAVLSTVLRTPVMMFYPSFLEKLINSWCDPYQLADMSYKGCVFPRVNDALNWLLVSYDIINKF